MSTLTARREGGSQPAGSHGRAERNGQKEEDGLPGEKSSSPPLTSRTRTAAMTGRGGVRSPCRECRVAAGVRDRACLHVPAALCTAHTPPAVSQRSCRCAGSQRPARGRAKAADGAICPSTRSRPALRAAALRAGSVPRLPRALETEPSKGNNFTTWLQKTKRRCLQQQGVHGLGSPTRFWDVSRVPAPQ